MKIILGDFHTKLGRVNIFKPTIRNKSLHQDRNDTVNFFHTKKNFKGADFDMITVLWLQKEGK